MTEIFIHGKLGRKFGRKFKFSVCRPKDAILAIETIHEGFSKEMIEMAKNGQQYSMIINENSVVSAEDFCGKKKISRIDIIPTIYGSGAVVGLVVGVVALVGAYAVGTATLIGGILLAVALTAISYGIQSLLAKPPETNSPSLSASTSATSKSFLFTNKENIKQQGNPVPIGYGRLRIGSSVIQETIKSYPNSISTFDEFVSQTTQEGKSSMSIINNQQI